MRRRQLICAIAGFGTATVGAAPRGEYVGVSAKGLVKVDGAQSVLVEQPFVWTRLSNNTEFGLLPGQYGCQSRDSDARLFVGRQATLYMRSVRGEYLVAPGGVWLPDSPDVKARFFIVQRKETLRRGPTLKAALEVPLDAPFLLPGDAILDAMLQWASDGHMMLLPEIDDPLLLARLRDRFGT